MPNPTHTPGEVTQVDGGFTPENIADAEWLVANMPGIRRFHDMATYERAMICHTAARFRAAAIASTRTVDTELLSACSDWIAYLDADGEEGDGNDEERMLAAMRAAITKATGHG